MSVTTHKRSTRIRTSTRPTVNGKSSLFGQITKLGTRIQHLTQRVPPGSPAFAEIATNALADTLLPKLTLRQLLRACFAAGTLPPQRRVDEGFGQPSVTVYRSRRFTIDLLFWHTATTGIHQHQFAGAFAVLLGSSLHTRFTFRRDKTLGRSIILGELSVESVEILRAGDTRIIHPGAGLIHSLFHLDSPSVTVAIRSLPTDRARPEYEYIPPNLAIDPRARDGTKTIQKQLLTLSARFYHDDFEEHVHSLLTASDPHGAFLLLARARTELGDSTAYRRLITAARRRHGAATDAFLPAIEEQWRRNAIIELRSTVTNPEQRLFIALLLNLPDLASISTALASLYPTASHLQRIVDWVRELSDHGWLGTTFDETHAIVLRGLLERSPVEQIADTVAATRPKATLRNKKSFSEICATLIASPILEPLFK